MMHTVILGTIVAFSGASLGSFLGVATEKSRSTSKVSHCATCLSKLSLWEKIPLLSYLFLKKRCQHCKTLIPSELFFIELSGAILFAMLFWMNFSHTQGSDLKALMVMTLLWIYFSVFFLISIEDARKQSFETSHLTCLMVVAFLYQCVQAVALQTILTNLLLSGIFMTLAYVLSKRRLGLGDVFLGMTMGVILSFPEFLMALLISSFIGVSWILYKSRKNMNNLFIQKIAFAPALLVGVLLVKAFNLNINDIHRSVLSLLSQ